MNDSPLNAGSASGAAPLFVHLSDIHFDAKSTTLKGPNQLAREALLDDLEAGVAEVGRPDAVLVTGDIAFSGKAQEYAQAREFLRRVTDRLGIEKEQVQTVPGNHDVDRDKCVASVKASHDQLRAMSPLEAGKALGAFLETDPTDPLFAPLADYSAFALDYDCEVSGIAPYWEMPWPLGHNYTLRVRGLTTVMVSDWEDRKANLIVGTDQTILATPARDDVVMVLGHHPPDWWHDQDDAERFMRGYASVHLYGHKHLHRLAVIDDSVRVSAGAVHPERESDWEPRYNWLRLVVEGEGSADPRLRVQLWPRVMRMGDNVFRSGSNAGGWEPDEPAVPLPRLARRAAGADVPGAVTAVQESSSPHATAVLAAARREPMNDASGSPTPLRRALYRFGRLGYATQTEILAGLGLIEDDDRNLSSDARLRAAFKRAGERQQVAELVARIEAAADAKGSG